MSVDDLMTLLEGHPSEALVIAVTEPPSPAIFLPVVVRAPVGPAVAAVLLVLRPVVGEANGGPLDGNQS